MTQQKIPTGYKQTEVGIIPTDWDVRRIGESALITTGAKNTQDRKENGKYPFFVRSQTIERIDTYSFDGEAVLTAGDGVGTGKVFHYINGKFDFHQRVYKISDFIKNLDGYFFFLYFSRNFYNRIMHMTAKSSVDSVRMEMIADMKIPIPPTLTEQTRIATTLSDIDELITNLDELIFKKKTIKQGAMQQLLMPKKGWEVTKLGNVCERITTGKLDANAMVENGKYLFFTCSKTTYRTDTFAFDGKSLLIAGNGDVGEIKYYDGKFNAYQRTYVLQNFIKDEMFLYYLLKKYLPIRVKEETNQGAMPFIKLSTLTEMEITIPKSRNEQVHIATILSDMDNEIKELEQKKAKYEQIKQGAMQQLLTGKIRLK